MGTLDPTTALLAVEGKAQCGAVLRSLQSEADFEQCLDLQRATWGDDFRELVPPTILKIGQKVGGIVAGAFEDERMLGFVYGLSGLREGRSAHWSHMLAVHATDRGRGVGRDLKLFQRRLLRMLDIDVMFWSFDPLIARNAALNLIALGARPVEYVCDMYGSQTGSALHDGLGTDRWIVRWQLHAVPATQRANRVPAPARPNDAELSASQRIAAGVVTQTVRNQGLSWVEIPNDIDALIRSDRSRAARWREETRKALQAELAADRVCVGLHQDEGGRSFYVFSPPDEPGEA